MHIWPFAGAKVQAKSTKLHIYAMLAQSLLCIEFSKKNDGILKQREAAMDTFLRMTVSLKQAKRHWTLFQRWQCPWNNLAVTTGEASILFMEYCVDGCVWWGAISSGPTPDCKPQAPTIRCLLPSLVFVKTLPKINFLALAWATYFDRGWTAKVQWTTY